MKKALLLVLLLAMCMSAAHAEEASIELEITHLTDSATGMIVGRCLAPEGFIINSNSATEWGGQWQSSQYPARVSVAAMSADGRVNMIFASGISFKHLLSATMNGVSYATHQDGAFDTETFTPCLQLHTADGYADFVVSNTYPGIQIFVHSQAEITPELQKKMDDHANELYNNIQTLLGDAQGATLNGTYYGMVERTYSMEANGETWYSTVITAVEAMQMTLTSVGIVTIETSYTLWSVPFTYVFTAPASEYEKYRPAFDMFAQNTTTSEKFNEALYKMSESLNAYMVERKLQSMEAVREYTQSSMKESYDSSSTASDYSTELWMDYIFEHNDYTLDSGEHIKVSTAYDYVYADGDKVYATNSALDEPAGMTRLYP